MSALKLCLVVVVAACVGLGILMIPRGTKAQPLQAGAVLSKIPAPNFRLHDQFGHTVTLSQLRGRPVVLTFMQATCAQLCPVVAETIRRSIAELGSAGDRIAVVAVSADPEHDTPQAVHAFLVRHGALHRWQYLTGSRHALSPLWTAYHLYVAPPNAPAQLRQSHTSATYLLDSAGRERALWAGDPDARSLVRDLRILAGLPVSAPVVSSVPAPIVGHPAPDFTLRTLNGQTVRLHDLRGKIVLINFWATWCHPCRSEMPRLAAWYREMSRQGFTILGVDDGETGNGPARFGRSLRIPYPLALDSDGTVSGRYDIVGLPASILVNRQGIVASVKLGVLDATYLHGHIAPLLESSNAG